MDGEMMDSREDLRDRIDGVLSEVCKDLAVREELLDRLMDLIWQKVDQEVAKETRVWQRRKPEDEEAMKIIRQAAKLIEAEQKTIPD